MPRRGKRTRLAKGIYRDKTGLAGVVKVGSGKDAVQRERRFPHDTPHSVIKSWQRDIASTLKPTRAKRGTLAADAARYLRQVKHLSNWQGVRAEVRAWVALHGQLHRSRITAEHVRAARVRWLAEEYAPKTVNNRVMRLSTLYRTLDATPERKHPPTPCDTIEPLPIPELPSVAPDDRLVDRVAAALEAQERKGYLRSSKTRARFLVLATTGKRPCEVMRAQPEDVNLDTRVWQVRNAKGGDGPGIFLNDDMLAAWQFFIEADAWGEFDTSSYAKRLYQAGWPKTLRPYNLRHGVGRAMSARRIDLSDIQVHMGHKRIETTRRHYVPVLESRLEDASRAIDGRFRPVQKPDRLAPQAGTGSK